MTYTKITFSLFSYIGASYPLAQNEFLRLITADCIDVIKSRLQPGETPEPGDVTKSVMEAISLYVANFNAGAKATGTPRMKTISAPTASQLADFIKAFNYPRAIKFTDKEIDGDTEVGLYQQDGDKAGLYDTTPTTLNRLVRKYDYTADSKKIEEVRRNLVDILPRVQRTAEPNLVPVNNGIFDLETKTLLPFSPDYVFTTKSRIDYNPHAHNVVIHNDEDGTDWDVESWMEDLFEDPAELKAIWQIVGAVVRPNVKFNKCALFYSESGNNGKGTLCQLMRNLCGEGAWANISIDSLAGEFNLEELIRVNAIITDENDVGVYLEKSANFKAIVTWDAIQINRKFKTPISYQFHGFMVQCLNEMPRVQDKSDSFNRRLIFIPFLKCFTGAERKYIKDDYLNRPDVLEYVLYKVLHMDYTSIDVPATWENALEEYKENNNPILRFAHEVLPQLQNDFVPFAFLLDLYRAWYEKENGGQARTDNVRFKKEMREILERDAVGESWTITPKDKETVRATKAHSMDKPEPLITEYNLREWADPRYSASKDDEKRATFNPDAVKKKYRGAIFKVHTNAKTEDETA